MITIFYWCAGQQADLAPEAAGLGQLLMPFVGDNGCDKIVPAQLRAPAVGGSGGQLCLLPCLRLLHIRQRRAKVVA